jgi:hypothetical protein
MVSFVQLYLAQRMTRRGLFGSPPFALVSAKLAEFYGLTEQAPSEDLRGERARRDRIVRGRGSYFL